MKLALPVYHPQAPHQLLLRIGYTIEDSIIARLTDLRLRSLWVRYPGLEFLGDFVSRDVLQAQAQVFSEITDTFATLQKQSTARLDYRTYTKSIGELLKTLIANPTAALFLGGMSDAANADQDLIRHSSAVTYLSLLMGLKLEGYIVRQRRHIEPEQAKEVVNLGLGAMLHDIGVTTLAPDVRQRHHDTGDESDPAWREHPSLGYEMVRGEVPPSAATIVLNHHQRFDGNGYGGKSVPQLSGSRIHIFARITGLAEEFDRMQRMGGRVMPTVYVLGSLLQEDMFKRFDPQVLYALFCVVPPYPPGTIVTLSDGRIAVCVDHHPEDPCRPTVQILPYGVTVVDENAEPPLMGPTIDLSNHSASLFIVKEGDADVSDLNFPRPAFIPAAANSLGQT